MDEELEHADWFEIDMISDLIITPNETMTLPKEYSVSRKLIDHVVQTRGSAKL